MKILDVPTASISEVKRSPAAVFERSQEAENGVYVLSRGDVAGVMLTREQFESLNRRIEELEEDLVLLEAARRLGEDDGRRLPDDEVRSARARAVPFSEDDGWE